MDKEAAEEVVLQWEGQAAAVLLREDMAQVVIALLVARAVVDPRWEALVLAVDLLRWVGPEADLHLLEGQQSHNRSESPLVLKSPLARRLMNVSSA